MTNGGKAVALALCGLASCQALLDFGSAATTAATDGGLDAADAADATAEAAADASVGDAPLRCGPAITTPCADTSRDPHHCGACGHDCLGGECEGGVCAPVVLAAGIVDPSRVVAEPKPCGEGHIAWVTDGAGASPQIHLSAKDGSNARVIAHPPDAFDLAADATHVLWAAYTSIEVAPWDGATTRTVASGGGMYLLTLAGAYVYWGGPYSTGLGRNLVDGVGCGAGCAGFDVGGFVTSLGGGGTDVYVTHTSADAGDVGWVKRLAPDGGLAPVADGEDYPHAVVAADPWVFWAARDAIHRVPAAGEPVAPVVIVSSHVNAMLSDGKALFWTTPEGEVRTSDFDGNARTLATAQVQPDGIAVDDVAIYWVNHGTSRDASDGKLMKLAR